MTPLQEHLEAIDACDEAREWIGIMTAAQAWDECERADWLLWWAARTERNSHQQIVLVAAACARTALIYVPADEDRPRLAIEAAERWAREPSEENWKAARSAARNARVAGAASAAQAAACAALSVGWAAVAGERARADIWAAEAADYAASAAAHGGRVAAHRKMCQIVRSMLVCPVEEVA